MKLAEIKEYLDNKYPSVDPGIVLPAIRGEVRSFDPEDDEYLLIKAMYVARPLTYITLETEDPSYGEPNLLRIFSFTRGIDYPHGILPNWLIVDLIEIKYGYRPRFLAHSEPIDLSVQLGWQSKGFWRAGVLLIW